MVPEAMGRSRAQRCPLTLPVQGLQEEPGLGLLFCLLVSEAVLSSEGQD